MVNAQAGAFVLCTKARQRPKPGNGMPFNTGRAVGSQKAILVWTQFTELSEFVGNAAKPEKKISPYFSSETNLHKYICR